MLYKEWVKLIEEFKASGKSQAQWCKEKNLKVKAFNYQDALVRIIARIMQT